MVTSNHMQDDWPKATCSVILDGVQDDNGRMTLAYCPNKPFALVGHTMLCEKHYEEVKTRYQYQDGAEVKENARKQ